MPASSFSHSLAGAVYVIFGASDRRSFDAADLGKWGFRIDGGRQSLGIGSGAAGLGDMDGDGLSEILTGTFNGDDPGSGLVFFSKGLTR